MSKDQHPETSCVRLPSQAQVVIIGGGIIHYSRNYNMARTSRMVEVGKHKLELSNLKECLSATWMRDEKQM